MSRRLVIFGVGPFADLIAYHFEAQGGREVVAQTVHERFVPAELSGSRPVVPFETLAARFSPGEHEVFVAIEHSRQNAARADIAAMARQQGYRLASFVSPSAAIAANVTFGEHCFVMDQVIAQHGASFGENNILHAKGFFGQNCQVGSHNYFSAGFYAERFARIGSNNFFGSGVRVAEAIEIRDWMYVKSFQTIEQPMSLPTLIHPALRSPGHVIDRRGPKA